MARDGNDNQTSYSSVSYDYTDIETPSGITFGTITNNSIQAQSSNTPSGLTRGSSGLIIYNITNGANSGWKQNNDPWTSGSLSTNTQYGFRATARNGDGNTTSDSPTSYRYTLANVPGSSSFSNVTDTSIRANWTANGNPSGTWYYCLNNTTLDAGWTTNTYWDSTGLTCGNSYEFWVLARNGDGVVTSYTYLGNQSTLNCDDNYEPNNDMASAYDLSSNEYTWLSSIAGLGIQADDDWYEIYVTHTYQRVVVDLRFTDADGDIDLELVDASGTTLASSRSVTDNEYIDYTVPASGTYYIRVYYGNAGNTYDFWWDDIYSDDIYEENDTYGAAYDISSSANVWFYGVQYDSDWYRVYHNSEYLIIDVEFSHSAGDIDVVLCDTAGNPILYGASSDDNEHISYQGPSGYYLIRVYGFPEPPNNTGNTYRVKWESVIG
jgi:hypothetical protein